MPSNLDLSDDPLDPDKKKVVIAPPTIAKPGLNLPAIGAPIPALDNSAVAPKLAADMAQQEQLQKGSGVQQLQRKHKVLGTAARIADVAGSILAPGITSKIPGSSLYHQSLQNQNTAAIAGDLAAKEKEAEIGRENAQAEHAQAQATAASKPKEPTNAFELAHQQNPTAPAAEIAKTLREPSKSVVHETDQGVFLVNPDTGEATPLTFKGEALKPKPRSETPHTANTAEGVMQWDPETKTWKRIGSTPQMVISAINRDDKINQREAGAANSLEGFTADMDRLAVAANELKNHPGLGRITGVMGALPNIPGGEAANAQAKFDTLKSQIAFSVLQNLRNQSKTGGALGQVSDREEQLLASNIASLERAQSTAELQKALQAIIEYTNGAKERARNAFQRTTGVPDPGVAKGTIRFVSNGKTFNIPAAQEQEFLKDHPNAQKQ